MASRPVFIPKYEGEVLVDTVMTEFDWAPGLSLQQKRKNIENLHKEFYKNNSIELDKILEVSSKSNIKIGNALSAFNLSLFLPQENKKISVECLYQGSKVFENGKQFSDLYHINSVDAKRDKRLKESGNIIGFKLFDEFWEIFPENAFYNYIYIKALISNESYSSFLDYFCAFTDIEFNPFKSINCQAYAVALFMALKKRGVLHDVIRDKQTFLKFLSNKKLVTSKKDTNSQPTLF